MIKHTVDSFKKCLLFFGVAFFTLSSLLVLVPAKTSAQVTDKCASNDVGVTGCIVLVVKINAAPALDATVHAVRVKAMGNSSDDFYLDVVSGTNNSTYSSVGRLEGTAIGSGPCSGANRSGDPATKFKILVTGQASNGTNGEIINICEQDAPKATVVNGKATKTIPISVTTDSNASAYGGIQGTIKVKADVTGKVITCGTDGVITVTNKASGTTKTFATDAQGLFNSGYSLDEGTYDVHADCRYQGAVYPYTYNNIVVTKGVMTALGEKVIDGTGGGSSDPTAGDGVSKSGNACGISGDLGWIECPVLSAMNFFADKVDGSIGSLLTIDTDAVFATSGANHRYYDAWNSFRRIAVGLIIVAGLVTVFAQALGVELLNAYTLKKVAPRALLVVGAMVLSWQGEEFIVRFFNDMGNWIGDIITSPFSNIAAVNYQTIVQQSFGIAAGSTAVLVGGAAAAFFGFITVEGIIALIGMFCLSLIIALVVLTLRNMIVIICIITAPLALAAYILPGTHKIWALWKDAFLTSLAMFLIVEAFLASGKVLAAVGLAGGW